MENIILITEELDCDRTTAFNMFSKNELLENWLTVKADVDPKIGGKYELFWEPENKSRNSTLGCTITSIERNKYLSFDWKGPIDFQSFMNVADPLTHVILFFLDNEKDPNKTNIHLFHTGWKNDSEWQKARNYFKKAWAKALQGLKEKLKNKLL
jgi:uncharacterized protein YndB with AHSA1/START domain